MDSVTRGAKYFAAALVVFVCFAPAARARQAPDREPAKRVGVRLRAFIPGTSASMYFVPTRTGGSVRLTALSLPPSGSLLPGATHYVVWAVASGERPLRIGALLVDAGGNGGLEFARPSSFERYSVVVTAETSAHAEHPGGIMVFASRAGAVSAFYGEKTEQQLTDVQRKALNKELKKGGGARAGVKDFYSEVDDALNASPGGARVIELLGGELAPKAHGVARVATRNENVYVRTVIRRLPLPSEVGASTYILWGVIPGGRIAYMGSLPSNDFSDADTYVRVGGIRTDELDLLVSAESRRPVPSPSGLRALFSNTQGEERGLAYGAIEGTVLDAEGRPVAGATVELRPDSQSVTPDTLPVARTDEQGRFFLDGLVPGEHTLYASKEEAGYPSAYQAFFIAGDTALPKVSVVDRQVAGAVVVRLGPKAARLRARVVDGVSGEAVAEAEVVLMREDRPDISMSFGIRPEDGSFDRLIPSLPLRLKVQAPGYEDWYYGEDGSQENSRVLLLRNDAVEELTIRLRPVKGTGPARP